MRGSNKVSRRSTARIAVALAIVGSLVLPAGAITHGRFDGNDHPNAGSR